MFRLLSKEINLFSVLICIGFLLLVVTTFNRFLVTFPNIVSTLIIFSGIALGYNLFQLFFPNKENLVSLFLYIFFVLSFYPETVNIGISLTVFINCILLYLFLNENIDTDKNYLFAGSLLTINYIFLPIAWPTILFVITYIILTSDRFFPDIFKLFYGIFLTLLGYFCYAYFMEHDTFEQHYIPPIRNSWTESYRHLLILVPIAVLGICAVINHFIYYHRKSFTNKIKYIILLTFIISQILIITLYMDKENEYLIFMALPMSMILNKYLILEKKYWKQEAGLWLIILCLILFKINNTFSVI